MNTNNVSVLTIAAFCLSFVSLSGCSTLEVTNLDANAKPLILDHRIKATVGLEKNQLDKNDQSPNVFKWPDKLVDVLQQEGVFSQVISPYKTNDVVDLVVRSSTSGKFRDTGTANFFTWWPGPFIFAQTWRGTQFIYDLTANVELVDSRSNKVIGKYSADSSYLLVHSSGSPFHLLGAACLIPGIIKGSLATWPHGNYLTEIYKKAYPETWKKIAVAISKDPALAQYLKDHPSSQFAK